MSTDTSSQAKRWPLVFLPRAVEYWTDYPRRTELSKNFKAAKVAWEQEGSISHEAAQALYDEIALAGANGYPTSMNDCDLVEKMSGLLQPLHLLRSVSRAVASLLDPPRPSISTAKHMLWEAIRSRTMSQHDAEQVLSVFCHRSEELKLHRWDMNFLKAFDGSGQFGYNGSLEGTSVDPGWWERDEQLARSVEAKTWKIEHGDKFPRSASDNSQGGRSASANMTDQDPEDTDMVCESDADSGIEPQPSEDDETTKAREVEEALKTLKLSGTQRGRNYTRSARSSSQHCSAGPGRSARSRKNTVSSTLAPSARVNKLRPRRG